MSRSTTNFVCQQCGNVEPKWAGQCPNCGEWNTLVETSVKQIRPISQISQIGPIRLSSIKKSDYSRRISTKIGELDRVLGGGIVPGSVTLVAGEPGIGKSTLLLQVAGRVPSGTLYVAGEESAGQIASRAARLGVKGDGITVLEETDVDSLIGHISPISPISLIIIDSIQTLTTGDLSGGVGSVGQVRECASRLISFSKSTGIPLFMVGHVTKEGTIAGPRVLEHMVDTVLWFEGDRTSLLRILRAVKNRFGATDEVGIFSMEEKGLLEVSNPSKLFLSNPPAGGNVAGSAPTVLIEGTRPMVVEVQALVVPTKLAFPKRIGYGIDGRRLELLVAVLQRRAGLPLWDYDIFVNAAGGIRITEPAADLAIALAIASAFHDKPVASGTVAAGEVGLLGEVREVLGLGKRIKEARRLGFKNTASAKEVKTIAQAIRKFVK